MSDHISLERFLCQRIHDYEWKPTSGTHSPHPRQNPCAECGASAALVVEWLASEATTDEDEAVA